MDYSLTPKVEAEKKMTILDEIMRYKKETEVPARMAQISFSEIQKLAAAAGEAHDFISALKSGKGVSLIAEVKKASPSKGLFREDFDALKLAGIYVENGAAAMSVLTDAPYFQGCLEYLRKIRRNHPAFPLLRKDFIFSPYQVYEARAAGADAVLLIAAVLSDEELSQLLQVTQSTGMAALVEVHNVTELQRALQLKPALLGVNNRDLRDFSVNLDTCIELRKLVPQTICYVAESGIKTTADVKRLFAAEIDAMLLGEAFAVADDQAAKVREMADGYEN